MEITIPDGDTLPLNLQIDSTSKFPLAHVYSTAGVEIAGSPFSLSHIANGFYLYQLASQPSGGYFTEYFVFDDAPHTILNTNYPSVQDYFKVGAPEVWNAQSTLYNIAGSFGGIINSILSIVQSIMTSARGGVSMTAQSNETTMQTQADEMLLSTASTSAVMTTGNQELVMTVTVKEVV